MGVVRALNISETVLSKFPLKLINGMVEPFRLLASSCLLFSYFLLLIHSVTAGIAVPALQLDETELSVLTAMQSTEGYWEFEDFIEQVLSISL
jgi:hypothetical protein